VILNVGIALNVGFSFKLNTQITNWLFRNDENVSNAFKVESSFNGVPKPPIGYFEMTLDAGTAFR
jgi:hypothetical protein